MVSGSARQRVGEEISVGPRMMSNWEVIKERWLQRLAYTLKKFNIAYSKRVIGDRPLILMGVGGHTREITKWGGKPI